MKKIIVVLMAATVLLGSYALAAAADNAGKGGTQPLEATLQSILQSQGVKDIESIDCSKVTDKQLEDLGESLTALMHPGPREHAFMDRMMGGEGSPNLSAMERFMGARYLGCLRDGVPPGMMPGMFGGKRFQGEDNDRGCPWRMHGPWGMMGPWSGGGFMWIIFLAILVLVIYFVRKGARGRVGETPLDILKKRYAKGDITKEEFEQKKRDLGL